MKMFAPMVFTEKTSNALSMKEKIENFDIQKPSH